MNNITMRQNPIGFLPDKDMLVDIPIYGTGMSFVNNSNITITIIGCPTFPSAIIHSLMFPANFGVRAPATPLRTSGYSLATIRAWMRMFPTPVMRGCFALRTIPPTFCTVATSWLSCLKVFLANGARFIINHIGIILRVAGYVK